jgi:hypothetical protein
VSARRLQRFAALVVWASFVGSLHAQSNSKLRFVVLGHLRGDKNGELLANLPEVVAAVRAEDPDLVFLCGDLIWGDVDRETPADPAVIRADWERLDNALVGLGAPVYRVPGNHDICDLATRDVWLERYGSLPRAINLGNTRFLLLSSAWWPADGDTRKHPQETIRGVPLSETQIGFLSSELKTAPGVEHTFVFTHHMLWWEDDAGWWKKVAPVLEGHAVRAVFAGDYGPMKFAHLERGGIHYLQTSIENRVSLEMLRGREASRMLSSQFDNYIVVDIDGAQVNYSVRAIGALSTDKFSPAHYREVHEYDKDSYGRKLLRRWSTPERLIGGLLQVSLAAFAAGALFVLGVVLLRKLFAGRRA